VIAKQESLCKTMRAAIDTINAGKWSMPHQCPSTRTKGADSTGEKRRLILMDGRIEISSSLSRNRPVMPQA
jgi:hypothetical protein